MTPMSTTMPVPPTTQNFAYRLSKRPNAPRVSVGVSFIRVDCDSRSRLPRCNNSLHKPLTRPSDTLSPSDGERDGVRGRSSQFETDPELKPRLLHDGLSRVKPVLPILVNRLILRSD